MVVPAGAMYAGAIAAPIVGGLFGASVAKKGNQAAMVGAQRQAGQLGSQIERANLAASGQAELNKNQAQQFADQTKGMLNTNLTRIDNSVQGQLEKAQTGEVTRQKNLADIQGIRSGDIAGLSQMRQKLIDSGVDPTKVSQIFGADPNATYSNLQKLTNTGLAQTWNDPYAYNDLLNGKLGGWSTVSNAARNTANQINSLTNQDILSRNLVEGLKAGTRNQWGSFTTTSGNLNTNLPSLSQNIIANLMGNQQQATGLSKQGIASTAQIQNYNALNKLLGGTQTSQYQERVVAKDNLGRDMKDAQGNPIYTTPIYQAGKLDIDPTKF